MGRLSGTHLEDVPAGRPQHAPMSIASTPSTRPTVPALKLGGDSAAPETPPAGKSSPRGLKRLTKLLKRKNTKGEGCKRPAGGEGGVISCVCCFLCSAHQRRVVAARGLVTDSGCASVAQYCDAARFAQRAIGARRIGALAAARRTVHTAGLSAGRRAHRNGHRFARKLVSSQR